MPNVERPTIPWLRLDGCKDGFGPVVHPVEHPATDQEWPWDDVRHDLRPLRPDHLLRDLVILLIFCKNLNFSWNPTFLLSLTLHSCITVSKRQSEDICLKITPQKGKVLIKVKNNNCCFTHTYQRSDLVSGLNPSWVIATVHLNKLHGQTHPQTSPSIKPFSSY